MNKFILISTFIISIVLLVLFFNIDACMDAGGSWDDWGLSCKHVHSDFVPQYQRITPTFWILVLLLSGLVTLLIGKVISSILEQNHGIEEEK